MKKAILTYLIGREIVAAIVMISMVIGLLVACLVAYVLTPKTSDDLDNSYSYTYSAENHTLNGFTPNTECYLTATQS